MRVYVHAETQGFRYVLELDADDRTRSQRGFDLPRGDADVTLVGDEYRVELPPVFRGIHPDLHAIAIWLALRPFVGRRLVLPFAVSSRLADVMERHFGVALGPVDAGLAPRVPPADARPCLLYSGGVDSMAVSLLLPDDTVHLHLDRIPHPASATWTSAIVDRVDQRRTLDAVAAHGRSVHVVRDDHEHLFRPYPTWHTNMAILPALYLADSLDLHVLDSGDILSGPGGEGWASRERREWRLVEQIRAFPPGSELEDLAAQPGGAPVADIRRHLPVLGLLRGYSGAGLTEVATTRVVLQSALRGKAFSCFYPTVAGGSCMRCYKCFFKELLAYVFEDREAPAELFEHFLAYPHLVDALRQPYLDFHHAWYYLFQRLRCDHPVVHWFAAQARQGPDVGLLERWYSRAAWLVPRGVRPEVERRIQAMLGGMSEAEMDALERLAVPPFEPPPMLAASMPARPGAPEVDRTAADEGGPSGETTGGVDPGAGASDSEPGGPPPPPPASTEPCDLHARRSTVRVVFRDRLGRRAELAFFLGALRDGDPALRRHGRIGLAHAPCPVDKAFQLATVLLTLVMRAVGAPPVEDELDPWLAALRAILPRSPLRLRFEVFVSQGDRPVVEV